MADSAKMKNYWVLCDLNEHNTIIIKLEHKTYTKVKVRGAPIFISRYLKTFVWRNEFAGLWCIHEEARGTFIACGTTKVEALASAKHGLVTTGERQFFNALEKFGRVARHDEISLAEYYQRQLRMSERLLKKGIIPDDAKKRG